MCTCILVKGHIHKNHDKRQNSVIAFAANVQVGKHQATENGFLILHPICSVSCWLFQGNSVRNTILRSSCYE